MDWKKKKKKKKKKEMVDKLLFSPKYHFWFSDNDQFLTLNKSFSL